MANSTALRAAAEIAGLVMAMASSVVLARTVGPSLMGTFALSVVVGQIAVTIGDLGMAQALQVAVARGAVPLREASLRTFAVRLLAGSAVALAMAALTLFLIPPAQAQLRTLILLALLGSPLNALGQTWAFLATGRVGAVSALRVVGPACGLAAVVLLVHGPLDATAMALLFLAPLATSAIAGVALVAWLALGTPPVPAPRTGIDAMLAGARHFLVSGTSVLVSFNADRLILGILGLPVVLGLYDAGNRMVAPFSSVAAVVSDAHYRRLADADAGGREREATSTYGRVCMLLLVPTLPVGLGATMFGRELLELLFGSAFAPAYPYLVGLAWATTLAYLVACYTVPLWPWRETAAVARVGVAGAVCAVVAGVPLVLLAGGSGAALSRVAVQVALGMPAYPARRPYVNSVLRHSLAMLVPPVLLAGAAGWLVDTVTGAWLVAVLAFCAVYAVGAVGGLRRIARDEARPSSSSSGGVPGKEGGA